MKRPAILLTRFGGIRSLGLPLAIFIICGAFAPPLSIRGQSPVEPTLATEVQNTLNQVIVRWESNPDQLLKSYRLMRAPEGSDDWKEVVSCEYFAEKTYYAYRDLEVGKHERVHYRLEATGPSGKKIRYQPVVAQMTPYAQRLSYRVDMSSQTISFFGGYLSEESSVILMDLQGAKFEFPTAFADGRMVMDAIELPNGSYTYTVASGNKRRSGNLRFDRQMLDEVPGAFAFSPSRDE